MKVSAAKETDLPGILSLQKRNLRQVLSPEELLSEGFVTVVHDLEILRSMNRIHAHSVIKDGDTVIGYALAMHKTFSNQIPILTSMFERVDNQLRFSGLSKPSNYIVMGQICIQKEFRGKGLFHILYQNLKDRLHEEYQSIITEVDMQNPRSLKAHKKVGFETLEVYNKDGKTWNLIYWNWNEDVDTNQENK